MSHIDKIKTFDDLIKAKQTKEQLINNINAEFVKNYNIATIDLTKDLLINVIPNKIKSLIEQIKNPIVLEAEKAKVIKLDENSNKYQLALDEQKSILSIVTSNLKFKKAVSDIKKVSSEVFSDEKYVAIIGENGTSFQQVLEGSDIELAKRFVELNQTIEVLTQSNKAIEKEFQEAIKDVEYIEDNFFDELQELRSISKINWSSINHFDEEQYFMFYGQDEDYEVYKKQIILIKNLNKEYEDLKSETLKWDIKY